METKNMHMKKQYNFIDGSKDRKEELPEGTNS